jgi:hypothetical protein
MLQRMSSTPVDGPGADPDAGGSAVEEHISLGAQLPTIPPDETPGLLGLRDLSGPELAQYRDDAALLREVAPIAPYARAVDAVAALAELVEQLANGDDDGTLTRRRQKRVRRALDVVARLLADLPEELEKTLRDRLGAGGDAARHLSQVHAWLAAESPYRLASNFDSLPVEDLRVISADDTVELVATAESVAEWSVGRDEVVRNRPLGLVATAETALVLSQRMLSTWLIEHKGVVREASLRITRLASEIIEGTPAVISFRIRRRGEREKPEVLGITPEIIPFWELQSLQGAILRAERILDDEPKEPALRGQPGMYPEQVQAVLRQVDPRHQFEGHVTATDELASDSGRGDTDEAEPGAPAIDLPTVIRHLELGTMSLEQAWSRALTEQGTDRMVAQWASMIETLRAEVHASDQRLSEDDRYFELPLSTEEIARLELSLRHERVVHQNRLAQMTVLVALIQSIPDLVEPTLRLLDRQRGVYAEWIASGAFAAVRDRLGLIASLLTEPSQAALEQVRRSRLLVARAQARADPEAALFHAARVLRLGGQPECDSAATAVLELVKDAAERLGAGERLDLAAVTLLAHEAARLILDVEQPRNNPTS